jgi:hypothetical protein
VPGSALKLRITRPLPRIVAQLCPSVNGSGELLAGVQLELQTLVRRPASMPSDLRFYCSLVRIVCRRCSTSDGTDGRTLAHVIDRGYWLAEHPWPAAHAGSVAAAREVVMQGLYRLLVLVLADAVVSFIAGRHPGDVLYCLIESW